MKWNDLNNLEFSIQITSWRVFTSLYCYFTCLVLCYCTHWGNVQFKFKNIHIWLLILSDYFVCDWCYSCIYTKNIETENFSKFSKNMLLLYVLKWVGYIALLVNDDIIEINYAPSISNTLTWIVLKLILVRILYTSSMIVILIT